MSNIRSDCPSEYCYTESMESRYHYETIARAIAWLREHYREQPSLEEAARSVNMTRFHFQRLFTQWAGISPKAFLQQITLDEAKKALDLGRSTLNASLDVGLSGNSRLHDLFVKIEGCTPGNFRERCRGMKICLAEIDSPFGPLAVAETDRGISGLHFGSMEELADRRLYRNAEFENSLGQNGQLVRTFFNHWDLPEKPLKLDLAGSPFQIQVWKALLQIPPADLLSYGDVSSMIGNPGSVRAVGSAIARNPVAYLIPCHRVIRSTGEWGQYRWGDDRKILIHGYERAQSP